MFRKIRKYFLQKKARKDVEYHYKNFSILLPPDHLLPVYQKEHKRYDRFLPHLAKYIEEQKTVIDIGANVGDTLAGMFNENQKLNYICIEPDAFFSSYLEKNIKRIQEFFHSAKISNVKSLVGKAISNVLLEGAGGTKHAVFASNSIPSDQHLIKSKLLDTIILDLNCKNVRLLKTDIDGFDWDAIDSASQLLLDQQPMIFFECQYDKDYQITNYQKTITHMNSIGYHNWTIFDNFGEIILRTDNFQNIFQIMNYVWKQNCGSSTRTIYYCDILAVTTKDESLIDKVVSEY